MLYWDLYKLYLRWFYGKTVLLGTDLLRVVVHDPALHLPPVVGDVDQLPLARPQHGVRWQRGEEPRAQDAALTVVTNLVSTFLCHCVPGLTLKTDYIDVFLTPPCVLKTNPIVSGAQELTNACDSAQNGRNVSNPISRVALTPLAHYKCGQIIWLIS